MLCVTNQGLCLAILSKWDKSLTEIKLSGNLMLDFGGGGLAGLTGTAASFHKMGKHNLSQTAISYDAQTR